MLNLDPSKLAAMEIPIATGWLLAGCMEARHSWMPCYRLASRDVNRVAL